jgi:hypothetical protein
MTITPPFELKNPPKNYGKAFSMFSIFYHADSEEVSTPLL